MFLFCLPRDQNTQKGLWIYGLCYKSANDVPEWCKYLVHIVHMMKYGLIQPFDE